VGERKIQRGAKRLRWNEGFGIKGEIVMMTNREISEIIRGMFPLIPKKPGWCAAKYTVFAKRNYHGRERYVVGYSHSRIGAHHTSGLCYDRILGYGDTQEQALAMMRKKLNSRDAALTPNATLCGERSESERAKG
jgi:hypothetical protein